MTEHILNGASSAIDLSDWVIAYTQGESGWVGKQIAHDARSSHVIQLCPAYSYDAVTQSAEKNGGVHHGRMRRVLPAEMMASDVTIECCPHSVLRFSDLDAKDREYFLRDVLEPAFSMHKALRAQRAGIVAATAADAAKLGRIRG